MGAFVGRDEFKSKLRYYGVKRDLSAYWRAIVAAIIGVAALGVIAYVRRYDADDAIEWGAAALALGALAVSYVEWMLGRRELSTDRFYDRLKLANDYRQQLNDDRRIDDMTMYVFAEVDNLEYVIERYRHGYMSHRQAWRGVETFKGRLDIREFDEKLGFIVGRGCGYSPMTCTAIRTILSEHKHVDREACGVQVSDAGQGLQAAE